MPKQNVNKKMQSKTGRSQKAPIAIGSIQCSSQPRWLGGKNGVRIVHRELAGKVTNNSITSFALDKVITQTPGYDLNPACSILFPWLSGVAINFERYRFNSVKIRAVPAQPTTAPGRAYLAIDFDYDDLVPTTAAGLMANKVATEGCVWQELSVRANSADLMRDMPWKYCTSVTRSNFIEPRTSYSGFLLFGCDTTVGCSWDLWVEYDISLETPVLEGNSVLDSTSNTYTGYTYVCPNVPGTSNYGQNLKDDTLGIAGIISQFIPGSGGVTLGKTNIGISPTFAYDLGRAIVDSGTLTLKTDTTLTGMTPAVAVGTGGLAHSVEAYNSLGVRLANLSDLSGVMDTVTGAAGSAMTTSGGTASTLTRISLALLKAAYPTARYLVPLLVGGTSLNAAGPMKHGFKFEL